MENKTRWNSNTAEKRMWKYAEAVRKAIVKSNLANVTAFVPKRMGVIHVKDLDIEATKEDVAEGIGKAIGIQEPHFEVKVISLRPAFSNTQNATVILIGSSN